MKQANTEKLIKDYYNSSNIEVDTEQLLSNLKPVIASKCKVLKDKRESYFETLIFALICIGAFVMGVFFLFPEVIDYTDEVIQFLIVGFVIGFILIAIDIVASGLLPKYMDNKNMLRGKLS